MRLAALILALALATNLIAPRSWAIPAPPESLAAADQAYRERGDAARARQALSLYRKLAEKTPDSDSLWRVSMACYFVGLRLTEDSDAKEKLFAEGREAGLQAAKLAPDCAACHFWAAVNIALHGETVGIFKSISVLPVVEAQLQETIRLDPTYAGAGAYRILGIIQQKLPGILGGSNRRAREYFEKSIALAPDEPLGFLFLARFEKSVEDDADAARRLVKRALAIPPEKLDRLESIEAREELLKWNP